MTGLALSRRYYEGICRPFLEEKLPQYVNRIAVGMVGEGSECFGWDDAISRDHDWGVRLCFWLTEEDMLLFGEGLRSATQELPKEFEGFPLRTECPRSGIFTVEQFYETLLGQSLPATPSDWLAIPESKLAAATNGAIFTDPVGAFSAVRNQLLAHYPSDVRLRKLAHYGALGGQTGQYNLARSRVRESRLAAYLAKAKFVESVIAMTYLLNKTYAPFYKWAFRGMGELPLLAPQLCPLLTQLIDCDEIRREYQIVEEISAILIAEMRKQELTSSDSDFLLDHCGGLLGRIQDPQLATQPISLASD